MSSRATVIAPANIAFIKYWGTRDEERVLPFNASLSMTLRRCFSRTTVEHLQEAGGHEVLRAAPGGELQTAPADFSRRVEEHLERLRVWAGVEGRFRVATENSFPMGAGMASSASGFAALTLAVVEALRRRMPATSRCRFARRMEKPSQGRASSPRAMAGS